MVIKTDIPSLATQTLSRGPAMRAMAFKKRIFQVRFGDGKVKTIRNMEPNHKTRAVDLYIKKFPFGTKKITIPINQLLGWNQYSLTSGKYCFDCPVYDSNGSEIKVDQDHVLVRLATKIDLLEKQLQESDATVAGLRYELNQIRGTTDEAVEKRISQMKKLSEAHSIGTGKLGRPQQIPYYPEQSGNLAEGDDR